MRTCKLCKKQATCRQLCEDMRGLLKNSLKNNAIYSDNYNNFKNTGLGFNVYTSGLSAAEERAVKRVIVAVLEKSSMDILKLLGKGYTQKQIAKKLSMSQSNVSNRLKSIRLVVKESVNRIIEYII